MIMKLISRSKILLAFLGLATSISSFAQNSNSPIESTEPADIIIINAKVLTLDSDFNIAQSVAIRSNRIISVGKDRLLEKLRGPSTRVIDAQDRIVMPGLYDGSVRSYTAAVSELKSPLSNIDSSVSAQDYIRRQASNKPAYGWIILSNLYPTRLKEGRLPLKADLDAATTNYAVLWDFGPLAVVNSKALEASKITKETMDPPGGQVDKDPKHRNPTGLLRNAKSLLKLPPAPAKPTRLQERNALKALYALYNQQGITSIGEAQTGPGQIDLFRDLSRSNELTVRINCTREFEPGTDIDAAIDRLNALTNGPATNLPYGPTGAGDDWVRMGPLKIMIDGDLRIGTAYLRTPYGIGPAFSISELAYRGESQQDAFILPQFLVEAAQRGWQLAGHAAGDAALDSLLNGYERAQFQQDIRSLRCLVLDSEFQASEDWPRAAKLGLGVVIDPNVLYLDGGSALKTLGEARLNHFAPMKGWFSRGLTAGAASGHVTGLDSLNSVSPWNPWQAIWTTLTRQTRQGSVIHPEEQLSREQAIRLYTYNNAWLHREETQKGTLEAGKLADLVVLDTDILKCPVDQVRNTKALMTMVDGKVVWEARLPFLPATETLNPAITLVPTNSPSNLVPASSITASTFSPLGAGKFGGSSSNTAVLATANSSSNAVSNELAELPTPAPAATNAEAEAKTLSAVIADSIGASNSMPIVATAPMTTAETNTLEAMNAVAPAASNVSSNVEATVITVSNQTASVTVTIQPLAHTGSNVDNTMSSSNSASLSIPPSSPGAASTNAATSAVPPMDSATTNAAASSTNSTENPPVATSKGLFDWSRLFGDSK